MGFLFEKDEREKFLPSVKLKIITKNDINKGIDIETAFICGYLDVNRAPLKGINAALKRKDSSATSIKLRDEFIKDHIKLKMCDLLNNNINYDEWHRDLCEKIFDFYKDNGYDSFFVGKAQKWINMAIKYFCIYGYDYQEQLSKYMGVFHVPIDRYIANPIAQQLHIKPPCYTNNNLNTFDANKRNYSWSNINNYEDYLRCQQEIRKKCKSPLKWEFENWEKEKEKRQSNLS